MAKQIKELVIITGLSGAGKSTAIGFMEDIGYYCIDNMPPELLSTFIELISKQKDNKIAIVMDIRSTENFNGVIEILDNRRLPDSWLTRLRPLQIFTFFLLF